MGCPALIWPAVGMRCSHDFYRLAEMPAFNSEQMLKPLQFMHVSTHVESVEGIYCRTGLWGRGYDDGEECPLLLVRLKQDEVCHPYGMTFSSGLDLI